MFEGESFNLEAGSPFLVPLNVMSEFTASLQSKLLRTHWGFFFVEWLFCDSRRFL